jgi:hypothetical protein
MDVPDDEIRPYLTPGFPVIIIGLSTPIYKCEISGLVRFVFTISIAFWALAPNA